MSQNFSHNINSLSSYTAVNVSNNFKVTDDRSNILAWLSPLDPKSHHQDIQDRRVEDIGNGCYKLRNLEVGTQAMREAITQFCSAMETREPVSLISGNEGEPSGIEGK